MKELIERLEAAQGPCRALDHDIATACGWKIFRGRWQNERGETCRRLWDFTASLDAAMQLLKPGTLWSVGSMEEGPFARLVVPQPDGSYVGGYSQAYAKTPAIALCVACLKAIAADKERK